MTTTERQAALIELGQFALDWSNDDPDDLASQLTIKIDQLGLTPDREPETIMGTHQVPLSAVQLGDRIIVTNGDGPHIREVFAVDTTTDSIAYEGSMGYRHLDEPVVTILTVD